MSGYDKFFKDAGKVSGLVTGKPAPKSKSKFKLQDGSVKSPQGKSQLAGARGGGDRIAIGTPEDQIRRELARRQRERKATSLRKRQAFPTFPAIIAVVAIVSCTVGYFKPDLVDEALSKVGSHIEIGAFAQAKAADSKSSDSKAPPAKPVEAAKAAAPGAPDAAKLTATEGAAKGETPSDIRSWSDEELSFFNKLNDRKKELDQREAELVKLDEELQKQKVELDQKIKQLESMRTDISKTLKTRVAVDQEKVDRLVQTYSTMKPQNAAKIIETLNEDLAVEVMDKMKKKNAAEIMNMMDAKKARKISELLTGYQRTPAMASSEAASADDKDAGAGQEEDAQ